MKAFERIKPMGTSRLEHVNLTASDPEATAKMLHEIFGWTTRWDGPAMAGGRSMHVGNDVDYVAIYSPDVQIAPKGTSYHSTGGLNHVGVVVEDIDATEEKVKAYGLKPHSHADYEPGRRFYFHDHDEIEWEVVSYD